MSYDIYLFVDGGGEEPVEAFWVNYAVEALLGILCLAALLLSW